MIANREKVVAGAVFGGALMARLAAMAFAFDPNLKFEKYFDLARQLIANGWVAKDAFAYAPGYVYFMAALWRVFGSATVLCLVQILLGSLSCLFIYFIARRLFGPRAAAVAGAWAAVFGPFLLHDIEFLSDGFGMFLYCAAALALLRAMAQPGLASFALSGLLIGLRATQRPNVLLLVPMCVAVMLFDFVRERGAKRRIAWCAALCLAALLPILPFTVQNYLATGDFILVTDSGGYVFYCSNNHASTGLRYSPPPLVWIRMSRDPTGEETYVDLMDDALSRNAASLAGGRTLSPAECSRFWRSEAMKCIRRRGLGQIALTAEKLFYMFNAYEGHDTFPALAKQEKLWALTFLGIGTLAPFALVGIVVTLREWRRLTAAYALVLTPVISMAIFYVAPRFRLGLEAMLIPFAACALVWLSDCIAARRIRKALAACAGVVILMIGTHISDAEIIRQGRLNEVRRHLYQGHIARDGGRLHEAITEYQRAILQAKYPGEAADARRALAGIYRQLGDIESAREQEQIARGLLPPEMLRRLQSYRDDFDAHFALGRHYLFSGEYRKALGEFARATKLKPFDPTARFYLARAMRESKAVPPEEVLSELAQALEYGLRFSSSGCAAHVLMGRCHMEGENWRSAAESLEEALRLSPNEGAAHALLAEVYLKMGDSELAKKHASRARELGAGEGLPPEL